LVEGILDNLQLLATRFPEVTTLRGKDQLAKAIKEVAEIEPSLPDGFEQTPTYAHYSSGAQNNNTGGGTQNNNNSTGALEVLLRDDPELWDALESHIGRCHYCNHLEPHDHPKSTVAAFGEKLISTLQIKIVSNT
jgi:hypothetical protein